MKIKRYIIIAVITTVACLILIVTLFLIAFSGVIGKKYHNLSNEVLSKVVDLSRSDLPKDERYERYTAALEPLKICLSDSACGSTKDGPCGCSSGGKNTGVNKKFAWLAEALHLKYYSSACVAVMSDDISCIAPSLCINHKCTIDTENAEVCEKSRDPNRCYYEFALHHKNPELCDEIKEEKPSHSRQSCLMFIAVDTGNVSVCERLDRAEKIECEDDFYYRTARHAKNYEPCLKIKDEERKNDCLEYNLKYKADTSLCELISDEEKINTCISVIIKERAKEMEDPELCRDIPTETIRARCLNEVGPFTGDFTYCTKDENDNSPYYKCLREIGRKTGNYSRCDEFKSELSCIIEVIKAGHVETEEAKEVCIGIGDRKYKNECLEAVNKNVQK